MSRTEVKNVIFAAAFGADAVTGSFVQIWAQPMEDQEMPLVIIDNRGVRRYEGFSNLPYFAQRYIEEIENRFDIAHRSGNSHPNIDAQSIGVLLAKCGMPGHEKDIYRALD